MSLMRRETRLSDPYQNTPEYQAEQVSSAFLLLLDGTELKPVFVVKLNTYETPQVSYSRLDRLYRPVMS